jgi:hypothetical protein
VKATIYCIFSSHYEARKSAHPHALSPSLRKWCTMFPASVSKFWSLQTKLLRIPFKCLPLAFWADVCYGTFSYPTSIKLSHTRTMSYSSWVVKRILGAIYGYRPSTFSILVAAVAAHCYLEFLMTHYIFLRVYPL